MEASGQDDVASRRNFLSMGVGLGALGTGVTSMPQQSRILSSMPGSAVFYPRTFGAVGDGTGDDYQALQDSITAASAFQLANPHHRVVLDLEGLTYLFGSPLFVQDKLTIENGCLHTNLSAGGVAVTAEPNQDAYAQLTCIDVKFRKMQWQDVVGLKIVRGLRCHLERCQFDQFRNGTGSHGLVLEGVQIANFIGCTWYDNDVHINFREHSSSGVPSTDCRFIGCAMVEAVLCGITSDAPTSVNANVGAASATFHCCSIETCDGDGSLVQLVDVRDFRFDSCRFEDDNQGSDFPLVAIALTRESSRPRFVNCTFSGEGSGVCVQFDPGVTSPMFTGNFFTGARVPLDAGGNYRAWGNYNLSDV
jgi:hypothetical protein